MNLVFPPSSSEFTHAQRWPVAVTQLPPAAATQPVPFPRRAWSASSTADALAETECAGHDGPPLAASLAAAPAGSAADPATDAQRQDDLDRAALLDRVLRRVQDVQLYDKGHRAGLAQGRRQAWAAAWWQGALLGLCLGALLACAARALP